MEKTAAKSYKDPAMNRLVTNKSNWNKEVSSFINDLIHLKKMLNGSPSKFYTQRSSIVKPIPADPATIIGSLMGDFQEIVNRGNAIVQEQIDFVTARNRRKGEQALNKLEKTHGPDTQAPPPTAPAGVDLAKQLGASDNMSYYLISEASNPLTRFFSRLLSPGIGFGEAGRIRKLRVSLLNSMVTIYKDLKSLQSKIVPFFSGPESIKETILILDKIENGLIFILAGLKSYSDILPKGAVDTGGKIESKKESGSESTDTETVQPQMDAATLSRFNEADKQAMEIIRDIQANGNIKGVVGLPALRNLAGKYSKSSPKEKESLWAELFQQYHQAVIQACANRKIPPQRSFADILAMQTQTIATVSAHDQLQIVAQNLLGKWRHQLSMSDKTSALRLDVYKIAGEARKISNTIMDKLEDGLNTIEINKFMEELIEQISKIRELMNILNTTTKGMGYQPQFVDMLQRGRLGDHGVNINQKQKEQLNKLLEQKRINDISKMIYRK